MQLLRLGQLASVASASAWPDRDLRAFVLKLALMKHSKTSRYASEVDLYGAGGCSD
jgi:hypothetical protein